MPSWADQPVGDLLLAPTVIYVPSVLKLAHSVTVKVSSTQGRATGLQLACAGVNGKPAAAAHRGSCISPVEASQRICPESCQRGWAAESSARHGKSHHSSSGCKRCARTAQWSRRQCGCEDASQAGSILQAGSTWWHCLQAGNVADSEMFRTFNMGIGMVAVVAPENVDAAKRVLPESLVLGRVTSKEGVQL